MRLKTLTQPRRLFTNLLMEEFYWLFPTKLYVRMLFCLKMGYKLNLKNPKTFSEKLQWLKIYNRRPEYKRMVDKATVKDYVAGLIGDKYIIPTIGKWEKPEDIDWEQLPNQFVLKTTHGGGSEGVIICKDKNSFNKEEAVKRLNKGLKQDIWGKLREWPYKDMHKQIIAEQYLEDGSGNLTDYKFYCFNGKVKYCETITGRFTKKQIDFFDLDWNHEEFTFNGYEFADERPTKPECFDTLVEVAGKLCKDKPYSRIDLYVVGNKVYFGEITFFPASGFRGFHPDDWNNRLGNMIILPEKIIIK